MTYYKKPFVPRKPVKTFRDLEVYQKMLQCSVIVSKNVVPKLFKRKYEFVEKVDELALNIPLLIAEAHSLRFADFALGVGYLEKAMSGANKMVVYLEQIQGLYGSRLDDKGLVEDLITRYIDCRIKIFHLEKSWKRFRSEYNDLSKEKGNLKY